ncbi:MAG: DegT/DnrJ/EryC1/StrS family aminotransferase [Proteobacteria bacterium]|nr:DegT/DnrJ/EryC1/StrS family aminotransferase [Pseudomonadota bacterium]
MTCDEYGILVVEDAAESLGSNVRDHHSDIFGKLATLRCNGNEVTTTRGGMNITNDEALAKRTRHLTTPPRSRIRTSSCTTRWATTTGCPTATWRADGAAGGHASD